MMSSSELSCVFCKELFDNKDDLQIHFRKHGDPKFNDSSSSNDKTNENSELVKCDVCMEEFPTISKAITHKHKAHPEHDTKYFCSWCGKLFTMKHLYNKHVQSTHVTEGNTTNKFHCDGCDVDFLLVTAMVYHNKFFHRQDTLADIGHSKKVQKFDTEILSLYYCPFCGEENLNKVNLHKHINDDHIDENQSPDEILRCPLCEAIFFHLDAYEVHLTYHSTDDMYSQENEIVKQVVDFSLEAVPPLMEQVEDDCEQTVDTESAAPVDFANFLQQALTESNDNDDSSNSEIIGKKSKKHKKHKKSKKDKNAITLDEFLSMNQDVFGEGLDFQGIEEVPTQVVKKQLKKPPAKLKINPKITQSSELKKLQKQGIVVKLKSNKTSVGKLKLQGMKVMTRNPTQNNAINQIKSEHTKNATCSSEEVLSKLLNQGNSQLKIVKKITQEQSKPITNKIPNSSDDTKEDAGVETENFMDTKDSELKLKDNTENVTIHKNKVEVLGKETPADIADKDTSRDDTRNKIAYESNNSNTETEEINDVSIDNQEMSVNGEVVEHLDHSDTLQKCSNQPNIAPPMSLNPLKNISHLITIKSISSKNATDDKRALVESDINQTERKIDSDKGFANELTTNSLARNNSKKSIDTLKSLCHLTVKPVNLKSGNLINNTEMEFEKDKIATETYAKSDKSHTKDDTQENDLKEAAQPSKMSHALEKLSKHITVKPPQVNDISKPATDNYSSEEDHAYCSDEDNLDDFTDFNIKTENGTFQSNKPLQSEEKKTIDVLNRLTNVTAKTVTTKLQTKNSDLNLNISSAIKDSTKKSNTTLQLEEKKPIDVLNRLTNIIAKPLFAKPQIKSSNMSTKNESLINVSKGTNDDIEIFNIDDSDDEDLNTKSSKCKTAVNTPQDDSNTSASILKNLCKSITVKSPNVKNDIVVDINKLSNRIVRNDVASTTLVTSIENKQPKSLTVKTTQNINDNFLNKSMDDFEDADEDNDFDNIADSNMKINTKVGVKNYCGNNSMTVLQKLSKSITIKSNSLSENIENNEISNKIDIPKPISTDKSNSRIQNTELKSKQEKKIAVKGCNNNKPVTNKSFEVLKNLSKNITIKSSKSQDIDDIDDFDNEFNSEGDSEKYPTTSNLQHSTKPLEQLKSLGKDIVIKTKSSKISEDRCESYIDRSDNNKSYSNPTLQSKVKQFNKNMPDKMRLSFSEQLNNRKLLEGFDSDSDSSTKGTKITEMEDDGINSEDENGDKLNDESFPPNMSVESPHSHDETFDECDEDFDDIESVIKVSKLKNPHIQKGSNKIAHGHESETNIHSQYEKSIFPSLSNTALSIKPFKPAQSDTPKQNFEQGTKNINQSNINRCSTSTDTVSKEVNVKTFQSKTVIEEITTTVTKTIRTVNQTVQQEERHTSQSNQGFKTPMRPLKVQGMPVSNQRIKNYQGVTVRQAAPIGPRIRNPTVLSRPIRPSNQILPMRPIVNTRQVRPAASSPGISSIRPNQSAIGRPLKISPNVLVASSKPKEELKGHFSCFKKPKESLIPVPDSFSANMARTSQGESSVHYSAKQISRSSFNSTTKIVQGNSTSTSVQSTSQMCARSEQMSKLKNMSGLKVVKTSQSKQALHVEEQREGNATKRTTLEAIEKLQKQGLLVKKPRLDDDHDHYSEHSNSDGDDDI